jgi:hypothetical protein
MSHKTQLMEHMRGARAELEAAVRALEGRFDAELDNDWRVRDVVAHLALWERVAVRKLTGAPVPFADDLARMEPWNLDAFNEGMRERWREHSTTEILDEFRAAHQALLAAVADADDAACAPGGAARQAIDEDGAGHYGAHLPELRAAAGR